MPSFKGNPDTPQETLQLIHDLFVQTARKCIKGEITEDQCYNVFKAIEKQYLDPADANDIVANQIIYNTKGLTLPENNVFRMVLMRSYMEQNK